MERNDLRTGVVIPVLQAAITGIVVAAVIISIYKLADKVTTFRLFCAIAFLVMVLVWWRLLSQWQSYVFSARHVDAPSVYAMDTQNVTPVAMVHENGEDWFDLPIAPERMRMIAQKIQRDMKLSHALVADRTISRAEYESLRDEMVRKGLARWVNERSHNQGVELTRGGKAFIKSVLL